MRIHADMTVAEVAALVSQSLEAAGMTATLSGGAAVSVYTDNEYESKDLDFVSGERREALAAALRPWGFSLADDRRHFVHPETDLFLEFPPAPLQFGNRVIRDDEVSNVETAWGPLRVITPTQCVMDRLAAFWHWHDRQSWDQAVMVARHCDVDFEALRGFAQDEGANPEEIARLRRLAARIPRPARKRPR